MDPVWLPEPDFSPVSSVKELREKYGTHSIGLVVADFIRRAPEFNSDRELARLLGQMMGDLQSALEDDARRDWVTPKSGF